MELVRGVSRQQKTHRNPMLLFLLHSASLTRASFVYHRAGRTTISCYANPVFPGLEFHVSRITAGLSTCIVLQAYALINRWYVARWSTPVTSYGKEWRPSTTKTSFNIALRGGQPALPNLGNQGNQGHHGNCLAQAYCVRTSSPTASMMRGETPMQLKGSTVGLSNSLVVPAPN